MTLIPIYRYLILFIVLYISPTYAAPLVLPGNLQEYTDEEVIEEVEAPENTRENDQPLEPEVETNTSTEAIEPDPLDEKPDPTDEKPDPVGEKEEKNEKAKATTKERLNNIPKICNAECSADKKVWLGHVLVDGQDKSIDFLKAQIYSVFGFDYECVCKGTWTTRNNDPIWSHQHALRVCDRRCAYENGRWNGHWWTIVWGKHSVCQCVK